MSNEQHIKPIFLLTHTITNIYFLGIGGIGMSALARFFHAKGYQCAGYDHTETALTQELHAEGIAVNYNDSHTAIPERFQDQQRTLVVYTPAVPQTLPQYQFFKQHHFAIHKRAEVLGMITQRMKALCVAGTHGKTTTSTILAHILYQSEIGCNAFLGGVSNNYRTNLLLTDKSNYVVVEADEFDRSFHQLTPYMSVITSIDPDHLDIYGSEEAYKASFEHYISLIQPGGALIIKQDLIGPRASLDVQQLSPQARLYTYAVNEHADFYADNVCVEDGKMFFDLHTPTTTIERLRLGVPVHINIENSVAAMAIAWLNGVTPNELRTALASYAGVYRRFNIFECKAQNAESRTLIDDYAHHPAEINASIASIRLLYPHKRLTGVFQPHLYTRTRDFADEFAQALSALDEVILLPIYPARELPIEGVDSQMLLRKITCEKKRIIPKEEVAQILLAEKHEVIITLGAGDISQVAEQLRNQH